MAVKRMNQDDVARWNEQMDRTRANVEAIHARHPPRPPAAADMGEAMKLAAPLAGGAVNTEALRLSGMLAEELAKPAPLDLTLFEIEDHLAQLIEHRQERLADTADRPTEAEIEELDAAIAQYQISGPVKVARVAGIFRSWRMRREAAKAEAKRLQNVAAHFDLMEARLKDYCASILERLPEPAKGCRKLTGSDGSVIMLKGNGGLAPLVVTDSSLLPEECKTVTVVLRLDIWNSFREHLLDVGAEFISEEVKADQTLIREALAQPCEKCAGLGIREGSQFDAHGSGMGGTCEACGGTGQNAIAGAHLTERGAHVECK